MKNSKHDNGFRAPETVAAMEAQDPTRFCYICGRSQDDHEEMDHPLQTQAEARAQYDAKKARRDAQVAKDKLRARGRKDRGELRTAVKDLLELHFRAGNATLTEDERADAEMGFTYAQDDVEELLKDLNESLGA
jgi:hypothetical protein